MNKKILILMVLILVFFMSFSVNALTQISNCTDLQNMKLSMSEDYILMNNIDCSDTVNWNGGDGFEPVGNTSSAFIGSLDGKGYTIKNLFINRSSDNNIGLIGYSYTGTRITNISLESSDITGSHYTGALIGSCSYANVTFSSATGIVRGESYTGGLIGSMTDQNIEYSYADVDVTCTSRCGGLVGFDKDSNVLDCYAIGDVSGTNQLGGLVGYNDYSTITNSYATGDVSGTDNIGGLAGECDHGVSIVKNSYATGSITGSSNVGGLVGYNYNGASAVNSYWYDNSGDDATNCIGDPAGSCTGEATAKSDFYVKTHNVYDSSLPYWDFVNVWKENLDSYPIFVWQPNSFLTKVEFELSSFSGISKLDNSDGSVIVTIHEADDNSVVVSRSAAVGVYDVNMSVVMIGDKFNLDLDTNYTYNLSTNYGDFLYDFTTPLNLSNISSVSTKMEFKIDGFSGFTELDNIDGTKVDVIIKNASSGAVVVSRDAVAGVYDENMTVSMQGSKFDLLRDTLYTFVLSTVDYGEFLYNFTLTR